MKAEDTIMSLHEMMIAIKVGWLPYKEDAMTDADLYFLRLDSVARGQAKISFKAGIGEMVDLLKRYYNFALECEEIKAQLEEWGIKW